MYKIAVLITYYNEGKLLSECLDSLLAGSVLPDEIIVYDDASSLLATDFLPEHPIIRTIRGEENKGSPTFGRNYLLSQTKCDYVHFHDADDLFAFEWCKKVREAIDGGLNPPDIVVTDCLLLFLSNSEPVRFYGANLSRAVDLTSFFLRYGANTLVTTFSRKLALEAGGYNTDDLLTSLDVYFNIKLSAISSSFVTIDCPLVKARIMGNSLTRDTYGNSRLALTAMQHIKAMSYLAQQLPSNYGPDIADQIISQSITLFNNGLHDEALEGFNLAYSITTKPLYLMLSPRLRFIAQWFGPLVALRVASVYIACRKLFRQTYSDS